MDRQPPRKTLYSSQVEAHRALYSFWAAGDPVFGLVSPTGSGKTTIVKSVAARFKEEGGGGRRGVRALFVVVPQNHIQDGFREPATLVVPGEGTFTIGPTTWLPGQSTTTHRIRGMLHAKKRSQWFGATCSYQMMINALDGDPDLTGCCLSIDEAQHAGEGVTKLYELERRWVALGGQVLKITATPYRHDGRDVFKPGQPRYVKTIAEHALDTDSEGNPLVPPNMIMVAERLPGYTVKNRKELNGQSAPAQIKGNATAAIVKRWEKDGKPKLVVVVPQWKSKVWASKLQKAFERKGARVVNAVGTGKGAQARLRAVLDHERNVSKIEDSTVDVILACKRFDEGTDWPLCSHLYAVGFPGSFPLIVQRWGRTFRPKHHIVGHPHPDHAVIVFFCPRPEGIGDNAMKAHKRAALLSACFLHDHSTAKAYTRIARVISALRKGLSDSLGDEGSRQSGEVVPDEGKMAMAKAKLSRKATIEQILAQGHDLAVRIQLAVQVGVPEKEIRRAITQRIRNAQDPIAPALSAAFDDVLAQYRDLEVTFEEGVLAMIGMFTGETIKDISRRLSARLRTMDSTMAEIREFFDKHGSRPTKIDMDPANQWLRRQHRSSISKLCDEMGLPSEKRTMESTMAEIREFFDKHGCRPTTKDLTVQGAWLTRHGSSLSALCEEMGLPGDSLVYHLSRTMASARAEVREFFDKHGRRPKSKEVPALYAWLRSNHMTPLTALCDEMGLPDGGRTMESTRIEVREFFDKHDRRPKWAERPTLARWLRDQHTSLSDLCDEMGFPEEGRTMESTRKEIREFFDRHGQCPTKKGMNTANEWLKRRHTSVPKLCEEMGLPMESARTEVRDFFDKHGRRPKWKEVRSLTHRLRSNGMTLTALCDEMGFPDGKRTMGSAMAEVRDFFGKHGRRPKSKDLANIDAWLRARGSSLRKLCDEMGLPK